jgi:hypothetical protein
MASYCCCSSCSKRSTQGNEAPTFSVIPMLAQRAEGCPSFPRPSRCGGKISRCAGHDRQRAIASPANDETHSRSSRRGAAGHFSPVFLRIPSAKCLGSSQNCDSASEKCHSSSVPRRKSSRIFLVSPRRGSKAPEKSAPGQVAHERSSFPAPSSSPFRSKPKPPKHNQERAMPEDEPAAQSLPRDTKTASPVLHRAAKPFL